MSSSKKIRLAVIWYGDRGQKSSNAQQYAYLSHVLGSFVLRKYDFNRGEQSKLLRDWKARKIDVVLKNAYGRAHEATVEAYLELNRIPYLGSDANSTLVGTSKFLSKMLFREHQIPVVPDVFVDYIEWRSKKAAILRRIKSRVKFPCLIKDVAGTDSRGLYLVKDFNACRRTLARAIKEHKAVLVERYLKGAYEVTCLVVEKGKRLYAYEPVGVRPTGQLFSGKAKDTFNIAFDIPTRISPALRARVKGIARHGHEALHCRSFSRADFMIQRKSAYLLEVDVHPGFRAKSPTTLSVMYAGEDLNDLFLKLCQPYVRKTSLR